MTCEWKKLEEEEDENENKNNRRTWTWRRREYRARDTVRREHRKDLASVQWPVVIGRVGYVTHVQDKNPTHIEIQNKRQKNRVTIRVGDDINDIRAFFFTWVGWGMGKNGQHEPSWKVTLIFTITILRKI